MAISTMTALGNVLGQSLGGIVSTTAQQAIQGVMGHNANLASAQGQAEAERFNQQSVNAANQQNIAAMSNQYQYNSAQAANTNDYNAMMWQRAADWNEAMWERQAEFNAEQAEIQRKWSERMENTRYQRAVSDMERAGLNPILAVTGGGLQTGSGTGAAASVGGSSMGSASGVMASGGLLGADSASVGGYQGAGEFTGGLLALLGTAIGQLGSAQQILGQLGDTGNDIMNSVVDEVTGTAQDILDGNISLNEVLGKVSLPHWAADKLEKAAKWVYNKVTGKKEKVVDRNVWADLQMKLRNAAPKG